MRPSLITMAIAATLALLFAFLRGEGDLPKSDLAKPPFKYIFPIKAPSEDQAQKASGVLDEVERLLADHRFQEAEKKLQTLPDSKDVHFLRAQLFLAKGQLEKATQLSQKLTEEIPGAGSYTLRAQVSEALGDVESAQRYYLKAFQLEDVGHPKAAAYLRGLFARFLLRRGYDSKAEVVLEEALRISSENDFLVSLKADLAAHQSDWRNAEKLYMDAFMRGQNSIYLVKAARAAKAMEDKGRALKTLENALAMAMADQSTPLQRLRTNFDIALILLELGGADHVAEAERRVEEELQNRSSVEVLALKTRILKATGRNDQADQLWLGKSALLEHRDDLFP